MRILVCGDRNWNDYSKIENVLKNYPKDTVIIHGDCRGADKIADYVAKKYGMTVEKYPVTKEEWNKFGRGAGPLRNKRMLTEGNPDKVIAFHPNLDDSKGTKNTVTQAKRYGIPVELYS